MARVAERLGETPTMDDDAQTKTLSMLSDSLQLLCKANADMCFKRRDMIRPQLNQEFKALCSMTTSCSLELPGCFLSPFPMLTKI